MEEIGATIPKYQPLRVFMAPVVRLRTTNHPFPPNSLVYYTISTFIVLKNQYPEVHRHRFQPFFWYSPYKCLPVTTKIFTRQSFFFSSLFLCFFLLFFIAHFFSGACGSFSWNSGSFFQTPFFIHSFVCLIIHSFLHGFQPNFVSAVLLCMLYLSYHY